MRPPHKCYRENYAIFSGGGGIRTPGDIAATVVFKTTALDRSATPPYLPLHTAIGKIWGGEYTTDTRPRIVFHATFIVYARRPILSNSCDKRQVWVNAPPRSCLGHASITFWPPR